MSEPTLDFVRPVRQYPKTWNPAESLCVRDDTSGASWRPPTDGEIRSIQAVGTSQRDPEAGVCVLMLPNHLTELLWDIDPAKWSESRQDRNLTASRTLADEAYTNAMTRIGDFIAHVESDLAEPQFLAVVATQPPEAPGPLNLSRLLAAHLPSQDERPRRCAWINLDDKIQHILVARAEHGLPLEDEGAFSFVVKLEPGNGAIWDPDHLDMGQSFTPEETMFVSLALAKSF